MNYLWLIFGLLSALFASLVAIFGKIGLKNLDTNVATAIRAVIMALFLVLVIIFQGRLSKVGEILANKKAILFIVLSGVAGALSWLFYFLALKNGKVQQVAPIDRLSVVFAIVLAAIFLGEKISFYTGLGVLLIAIGSIFVALG
ncbi:EamA family transporter [Caldicellulosiruptor naganoensis]|uniref:EamA family transporter n=1 Tax=Caldicellulosiruptor naganoensis TaxID=29324 RepID=A0ABY7BGS3_9FIRM|nr:EamA family transporter [Caldicellulosiruptor naganoensis]WAM30801.1 EamA family transporter [Caldicellulosiruptor naganoensis]